ncbi:MAG TPA: uracil-DNA glycosylase [Luteitalea sp.]|nr:uracil-DNA glycosylase [Luteitalea sp.]
MSDASRTAVAQLRAHLQFYADLGVAGFSRDVSWTGERVNTQTDEPVVDDAETSRVAAVAHEPQAKEQVDPIEQQVGPVVPTRPDDVSPSSPAAASSLDALRAHIGPQCTRCKLCTLGRKQVVFGVGNPNADLMFVGEAPGADEDAQGEPFVGRAGQLLTKIIEAIELRREDVYIANVIKCRPPGNRNPEPDEVLTCEPFLFQQIDLVQPKVIVALGKFAAQSLLRSDQPITRLRGQIHPFRQSQLVPTFHPAYLLRSPDKKRETWEDMKLVRSLLRGEVR